MRFIFLGLETDVAHQVGIRTFLPKIQTCFNNFIPHNHNRLFRFVAFYVPNTMLEFFPIELELFLLAIKASNDRILGQFNVCSLMRFKMKTL